MGHVDRDGQISDVTELIFEQIAEMPAFKEAMRDIACVIDFQAPIMRRNLRSEFGERGDRAAQALFLIIENALDGEYDVEAEFERRNASGLCARCEQLVMTSRLGD